MSVSPDQAGAVKVDQKFQAIYPSTNLYAINQTVSLEAVPNTGYVFAGWTGAVSDTTNPLTITMDCSKTITATFVQQKTSINLPLIGGGIAVLALAGGLIAFLVYRLRR